MKFCETCGNRLIRQSDGSLKCSKGHVMEDEGTMERRKARLRRKKEQQKRMSTFPSLDRVIVCRLSNPYAGTEKSSKPFPHRNLDSFKVYQELREMESDYLPKRFRYIRGDPCASGSRENKAGIILVVPELYYEVKGRIESIDIYDSEKEEGYKVIPFEVPKGNLQKMIEREKERMFRKLENHNLY